MADVDECRDGTDECGDYSTCLNTLGTYLCRCNKGFKRGSSRFECEGEDHQYNYTCTVIANFPCTTDKNECVAYPRICDSWSQCVNTPGGYECVRGEL